MMVIMKLVINNDLYLDHAQPGCLIFGWGKGGKDLAVIIDVETHEKTNGNCGRKKRTYNEAA